MSQWELVDNSEPVEFDDSYDPLLLPTIKINDELQLREELSALMKRPPHCVVLRSSGDWIAAGIGPEFGCIILHPNEQGRTFYFVSRTPTATNSIEFRTEAGLSEVLPQHLLPMEDVIRLLQLLCFRNIRPVLELSP